MGQKASQPIIATKKELTGNLEYVECIYYVNSNYVLMRNLSENNTKVHYNISGRVYVFPYQDTKATRIAIIGNNVAVVYFTYILNGWRDRSYSCHAVLPYRTQIMALKKYDMGYNTDPEQWLDIDKITKSTVQEIEELKPNQKWGEHKLKKSDLDEIFPDGIQKNDQVVQFDLISHTEIRFTINNIASVIHTEHPFRTSINVTYDKFEKSIIVCYEVTKYMYAFQCWDKHGHEWKSERGHVVETLTDEGYMIRKMICTKSHLIIEAMNKDDISSIIVLKKDTFEILSRLNGCHVLYRDDYDIWFQKGIALLKRMDVIQQMSPDVLGIILSFVG